MMSNPLIERNKFLQDGGNLKNSTQYANDYGQHYSPFSAPNNTYVTAEVFVNPAASNTMTYRDAMDKTAILLGSAVLSGIVTILLLPLNALPVVAFGGTLVAFVLGMILAFKQVVPAGLAMAYAIVEGAALGALTRYVDVFLPGVALQTILATTVIVGVTLMLHYSGMVRTSSKGLKIVLVVAIGGIIFSLINFALVMFAGINLRSDITVLGIPLGVILGIVMILVAAYMLIGDFEAVNYAVANGAPKNFSWTCASAIMMTIIWIYIEVLRIAMILADRR